jgi:predicted RNase H-like nuclease (RuvC/YqgF family)
MVAPITESEQTKQTPETMGEGTLTEMIKKLSERIPAAERRIADLKIEREKLVVPARVDGNSAAQQRIRAIDEELRRLEHDFADDKTALDDLSRRLERAQKDRIAFEWDQRRSALRASLMRRRNGKSVSKVIDAARALAVAISKAEEEGDACLTALMNFAPRCAPSWNRLKSAQDILVRFAAMELENVLPIDGRLVMRQFLKDRDPETVDRAAIDLLLEQLDDLEVVA